MKKIILSIFIVGLLFTSCDLDVDPQGPVSDEQMAELIKKDPDAVLGPLVSGAVMYMHDGNRRTSTNDRGFKMWNLWLDFMGNDLVLLNLGNWFGAEYQMSDYRTATSTPPADQWFVYYRLVYLSNQILDFIPEDVTGRALLYKAQAMTLRALGYYYLVNIFQDSYKYGGSTKAGVPLYTTVEEARGRAPLEQVYTQIIGDLQEAIRLFADQNYNSATSKTDIDQTVANVVLARVLLTKGEYKDAVKAADQVISKYTLMDEAAYVNNGLQDISNPEAIFGYAWNINSSLDNRAFSSFMSPVCEGGYAVACPVAIDSRLYNQIPGTDYRKKNFLETPMEWTYNNGTKKTLVKYTALKFGTVDFKQDEVYMRVSEMHLVKAEALARDGDNTGAQDALYVLVSERDPSYVKSTKTGDALLEEILLQTRIELWGEGFEFFTNKRFNKGVDRTGSENHLSAKVVPAGKDFTFQIPQSIEMEVNPNLTNEDQNPL